MGDGKGAKALWRKCGFCYQTKKIIPILVNIFYAQTNDTYANKLWENLSSISLEDDIPLNRIHP